MAKLEEITKGTRVRGIVNGESVEVIDVIPHGPDVITLYYRDGRGRLDSEIIYRDRENSLEVQERGAAWSFTASGDQFRLVFEALRIKLAHLFDPLLAVHSSQVMPLPHQITAVYQEMLTRQPLRFLLADDPGAGKTIMAGLLLKELIARGDLQRCMIVCPGMLVEQWQDELDQKFDLPFEILTNDALNAARTGNWFQEHNLVICRLDKLSRNEEVQEKIKACDWDLIVCDEAHKMAASYFGSEVKKTQRYKLGEELSKVCRNFLLMTATPHNGKEPDFQLFMALIDGDRFEGGYRDASRQVDTSDLMRRLVKEKLVKFDGTPLFPERFAYTVPYTLSDLEARLYKEVTDYVTEEFNRAERLQSGRSTNNVGFALTSLQRRLASSPEAIYQSLKRRKERLEKKLREQKLLNRGAQVRLDLADVSDVDPESYEDFDDLTETEREEAEDKVIDEASAAQTMAELDAEIQILGNLERLAKTVRHSGTDTKWEQLASLLHDNPEMTDGAGERRKLVIFTEHRDTLNYLQERLSNALGRPEAIVAIHGGMGRDERRKNQEAFTQIADVQILVATDAAGEGINLQRSHLMVNYDLPWNPNRLEQRFGRIHRIGQTEVCHLWNIVAKDTREGEVYHRLLAKLEEERRALGDQVFDVLGQLVFGEEPLYRLLIRAVRYGDQEEVKQKLFKQVEGALDRVELQRLLEDRALVDDAMDISVVRKIREDMERAEARRLQPHFVESFFTAAFKQYGGELKLREPKRYEITNVPAVIRSRDRQIGFRAPLMPKYQRVTFEKGLTTVIGKPLATLLCPGQPLLEAVVSLVLDEKRELLRRGTVLVDPIDESDIPRLLLALEHEIKDGRVLPSGQRRTVSKRLQFVEISEAGEIKAAGFAPYLDYRPLTQDEEAFVEALTSEDWLKQDFEGSAVSHAIAHLVPEHMEEVRCRRLTHIAKTRQAVHQRLTKEISYWDARAAELQMKEEAGQTPRINSEMARRRRDELSSRLERRMVELEQEERLSMIQPVVVGGALIVPQGLLDKLSGSGKAAPHHAVETTRIELAAMEAVIAAEIELGYEPRDVSHLRCGYDIESRIPTEGKLRFIEVKGRASGAATVSVTKNEILTALNKPEDFYLAIVEVDGEKTSVSYIQRPFRTEPDFGVTSVTYNIRDLLGRDEVPV